MNKHDNTQKNQYSFSTLNNESAYTCQGSGCSCQYTDLNSNNRTEFDIAQKQKYQSQNTTDYGANMFKRFKK